MLINATIFPFSVAYSYKNELFLLIRQNCIIFAMVNMLVYGRER